MASFDAPLIRKVSHISKNVDGDPRPQAHGRLQSFGAFVSNAAEVRSYWLQHSVH
ncbi:hypothetical protein HanRHA438_Chr01g0033401 [Helianthus annuus]|nr:hypothetical protein HanRHA438_Chr01g0033401 [Helianthus annuus]